MAAHVAGRGRELEQLGDHLHGRYRELTEREDGGPGRADGPRRSAGRPIRLPVVPGWPKNQTGDARERNIVFVIPGRNRGEAVMMGDHYDTAYMEDVYEAAPTAMGCGRQRGERTTTTPRAPRSFAADVLLPLAREGKLERDVWLVHLTGEEFPPTAWARGRWCARWSKAI